MGMSIGFSPAGFNQIVVFTEKKDFKEIVAANPAMTAIIEDSDHNIYIAGIKGAASSLPGKAEAHLSSIQKQ